MVSFAEAVKMFFTRAFDFEGRSTRAEYWWVYLFYLLVIIVLSVPIVVLDEMSAGFENDGATIAGIFAGLLGLLLFAFVVICFIPGISLIVRRFHDLNQTGWLYLVFLLISILLPVWIGRLIWFCFPGTVGPNKYGEDPYDDFFEVFD